MTWRDRAACLDADTEVFYPAPTDTPGAQAVIRTYCHRCPVIDACLAWAEEIGDRYAILGGKTPERRAKDYRNAARRVGADR